MHRRQRRPVIAGLLLVALTGCAGPTATLGESIPAVGGAPRPRPVVVPEVGECRLLDPDAMLAASDITPATDCSGTHNALTYATGDVEGKPPFDDAIKKTCEDGFTTAVGLTQEQAILTIFSWAWYEPSAREYAEGARALLARVRLLDRVRRSDHLQLEHRQTELTLSPPPRSVRA